MQKYRYRYINRTQKHTNFLKNRHFEWFPPKQCHSFLGHLLDFLCWNNRWVSTHRGLNGPCHIFKGLAVGRWITSFGGGWKIYGNVGGCSMGLVLVYSPTFGSKNRDTPQKWMVKIMENLFKMDDLGVPLFLETTMQPRFAPCMVYAPCLVIGCQKEVYTQTLNVWYYWWFRNPAFTSWYGSLSHSLQSFIHVRWLFGVSPINSRMYQEVRIKGDRISGL